MEEQNITSKFNAGILQMSRLHKLQEQINEANVNPLASNMDYGVYNYQVIFICTTNIVEEAGNKLKDKEKIEAMKLKEAIEFLIDNYPVHEIKKHPGYNKTYIKKNMKHWMVLKKWLFKYEDYARGLLDKHNLNSPPEDESALF